MPTFRGVKISVKTGDDALQEWGVQRFPRANTISCYIQSQTDISFRVSLCPVLPYHPASRADPGEGPSVTPGEAQRSQAAVKRGKERNRRMPSVEPPDFHLLASLYLDGRSKPERRTIVYLDPKHREFHGPDGAVSLRTRWVEGLDGKLREHAWYFSAVGIESLFDKMLISHGTNQKDPLPEDELLAAMDSTSLHLEDDITREENLQLGQIVIELKRVTVGDTWEHSRYKPKHHEGDMEEVDMTGVERITHTTRLGEGVEIGQRVPVITYKPYVPDEGIFAKFQFFYRSEDQLRRFNFDGFPAHHRKVSSVARTTLNNKTAYMTPLSLKAVKELGQKQKTSKASGLTLGPRDKTDETRLATTHGVLWRDIENVVEWEIPDTKQETSRLSPISDPGPVRSRTGSKGNETPATDVSWTSERFADAPPPYVDTLLPARTLSKPGESGASATNVVLGSSAASDRSSSSTSKVENSMGAHRMLLIESDADDEYETDEDFARMDTLSEGSAANEIDQVMGDDHGLYPRMEELRVGLKRSRSLDGEEYSNPFKTIKSGGVDIAGAKLKMTGTLASDTSAEASQEESSDPILPLPEDEPATNVSMEVTAERAGEADSSSVDWLNQPLDSWAAYLAAAAK